jgi:hypothetical protein
MKTRILGAVTTGLLGTFLAFTEVNATAEDNDRVLLFKVPFKCEAVPQIGCGSLSKPILLELQRQPNISEAWLNGTGTVIAVISADGADREALTSKVKSTLELSGADGTELTGDDRETALKDFSTRADWYRGADVDQLSRREAAVIAARLVRRVHAKVSVPESTARTLVADLAQIIQNRFISDVKHSKQEFEQDVLNVVRKNLDEKGVEAFREAAAKGMRPLPEDKEGATSGAPDCCSIKMR